MPHRIRKWAPHGLKLGDETQLRFVPMIHWLYTLYSLMYVCLIIWLVELRCYRCCHPCFLFIFNGHIHIVNQNFLWFMWKKLKVFGAEIKYSHASLSVPFNLGSHRNFGLISIFPLRLNIFLWKIIMMVTIIREA